MVLRSIWKRKTAEEWIDTIKDRYKQKTRSDVSTKDLNAEIVGGAKSAAATIVEYAESENVDLIVTGSRGRTRFKKLLPGSVSTDVIKYAHCPVLVIR